jgi:hypothetical protein
MKHGWTPTISAGRLAHEANFKSYEPYGGVSVLCVGDFPQLKPLCDNYVFSSGGKHKA